MIVRREAIDDVGILDEEFFLYGEDVEWCWRMKRRGWQVGVCADVVARHSEGSSAARSFDTEHRRRLMVGGELAAVQSIRGRRFAKRYALATAFALAIEGAHPGRPRTRRREARASAKLWRTALRSVPRDPAGE